MKAPPNPSVQNRWQWGALDGAGPRAQQGLSVWLPDRFHLAQICLHFLTRPLRDLAQGPRPPERQLPGRFQESLTSFFKRFQMVPNRVFLP